MMATNDEIGIETQSEPASPTSTPHQRESRDRDSDYPDRQRPLLSEIRDNARGLAVIVTCDYLDRDDELEEIEEDGVALERAFTSLGFQTHWERNARQKDIERLIRNIRRVTHPKSPDYKCIVFAFSGHGGDGDTLKSQDSKKIHLDKDIVAKLTKSRKIAHIPKLFFIDACRGGDPVFSDVISSSSSESSDVEKGKSYKTKSTSDPKSIAEIITRLEGNYLIGYSTLPRRVANLKKFKGSVWMQQLAKELQDSTDSVQNIMDEVIKKLRDDNIHQQPETISRLQCGPLHLKAEQPPVQEKRQSLTEYLFGNLTGNDGGKDESTLSILARE